MGICFLERPAGGVLASSAHPVCPQGRGCLPTLPGEPPPHLPGTPSLPCWHPKRCPRGQGLLAPKGSLEQGGGSPSLGLPVPCPPCSLPPLL